MRAKERRAFFNWRYFGLERRRSNKRWAVLMLFSIPLFLFCQRYVVSSGRVIDISMLPTLMPGRYFLINKFGLCLAGPHRGDVVIVRPTEQGWSNWYYVKRVIGLEGETFAVSGGQVIINGRPLEEPYATGSTQPDMEPRQIPKGFYFVMGDNRGNSEDSRNFGAVPRDRIEGKIKP